MEKQLLKTKYLQIDLNKERYKKMHRIFLFFKVGVWKPLPTINKVGITKIKIAQRMGTYAYVAIDIKTSVEVYCIYLRSKRSNIRIMEGSLKEVERVAELIGKFLDKPIINYLERKK